MATIVKNMTTGQEMQIGDAQVRYISEERAESRYLLGKRFFNKYGAALYVESEIGGVQALHVQDGWKLCKTTGKQKAATKVKREPKQAEPVIDPTSTEPTTVSEPEPEPVIEEPAQQAQAEPIMNEQTGSSMTDALGQAFSPIFDRMEQRVQANIMSVVEQTLRDSKQLVTKIECTTQRGTAVVDGTTCANFATLVRIVATGKPLYMCGPAGCGKSYTARQIADALQLPFYETSQAMFAHDLKGYGDASGKYVQTAFYRAFTEGGVFFLDEVDASAPEALVVMNNAIANRSFDFPVIGNVQAHPDFRVIAAGNTKLTGATLEYAARQLQDASFKNRFFYVSQTYDQQLELQLARGDESIVEFAHDLRRAAQIAGISQLISYRQIQDMAELQDACDGDDAFLILGSVVQEKQADEINILHGYLEHKTNRWSNALQACVKLLRESEQQG